MNGKTPVSFLLTVLAWMAFGPLPAHAAVGEGKFHLVYLVSTDKVEVGAKAYVEPLLFTDGNEIKSVYNYCRQYYRNAKTTPSASQVRDDLKSLHNFCLNKATEMRGEKLHTLNNAGVSIQVGTVKFQQNATDIDGPVSPMMANAGTGTISKVSGADLLPNQSAHTSLSGPRYFFLMSSSDVLLRQIVPVAHYKTSELQPFLTRARKYAEGAKGKINAWYLEYAKVGGPIQIKFDQRFSPGFESLSVELVSPILVDTDKDGLSDLIVGMRAAPVDLTRERPQSEFQWAAIGIFLGNGETLFFSNVSQSVSFYGRLSAGSVRHAPTVIMKLGECNYLLSLVDEMFISYGLMALPRDTDQCRFQRFDKLQMKH